MLDAVAPIREIDSESLLGRTGPALLPYFEGAARISPLGVGDGKNKTITARIRPCGKNKSAA